MYSVSPSGPGTIEQWQGENPNVETRPKSREQWLTHDTMLDMVAYTIAIVSRDHNIPIERVDIDGVGANRRGVSSHNNYTYGSVKLRAAETEWRTDATAVPRRGGVQQRRRPRLAGERRRHKKALSEFSAEVVQSNVGKRNLPIASVGLPQALRSPKLGADPVW